MGAAAATSGKGYETAYAEFLEENYPGDLTACEPRSRPRLAIRRTQKLAIAVARASCDQRSAPLRSSQDHRRWALARTAVRFGVSANNDAGSAPPAPRGARLSPFPALPGSISDLAMCRRL